MNAIGYFKEDSREKLAINITTSDQIQLDNWCKLRLKYPEIMSTCVTNDWVVQCIRAQKRFSRFYDFIGTNTLILCADPDKEVTIFAFPKSWGNCAKIVPCSLLNTSLIPLMCRLCYI